MKRNFAICIGNWTADGQPCGSIENFFTDNDRWSAPFLFMAGLWVEIHRN
jgi:hypothetical protein